MKITRRTLLAASAAFAVAPALAQSTKNMTLVVPFPPGGSEIDSDTCHQQAMLIGALMVTPNRR